MVLPHQEGFRHRAAVLAWTTAICLVASLAWPRQSLADHFLAPLYGLFGALVTYGVLRLFLTGLAAFAEERFPRLALVYILFAFYGGILGTTLGLVAYPFQLHSLQTSQMPVSYYIATLPLGFFMAAAALPVLNKYYVSE
jgi:hypothetical protein